MGPLSTALVNSFLEERDGAHVYFGDIDKLWIVFNAPLGGYALGLIVSACISSQARKKHTEVIHVTGHFLRVTSVGYYEVHIRTIRTGGSYANISADLIQQNVVKVSAQFIFKVPSVPDAAVRVSLLPPSPYARRVPLHLHPSAAQTTPKLPAKFNTLMRWAEDKAIEERNRALGRGDCPAVGGGGLEWGAWVEFLDPSQDIHAAMLPFLGDIIKSFLHLLPRFREHPSSWSTLVLSVEYKAKTPDDPRYSKRTVGLYSCGKFLHDGLHDIAIEIWTAPSAIGEGTETEGWRENQVCLGIVHQTVLATSHQMALTVPINASERKAAQANSKL